VLGSDLYVDGEFTVDAVSAKYIARWNGSAWSALSATADGQGEVYALAVLGSDLYAGGEFTTVGG
jgi:hypothetical protein